MKDFPRIDLKKLADEIEAAIEAGTLNELPQFANVDPDSRLHVAKGTVAAYRENERRMGR